MSHSTVNTSYEPFSDEPEYIEGNRAFVSQLTFAPGQRVLDVACGTSTISRLILNAQPDLFLIGLDLSRESLTIGRQALMSDGLKPDGELLLAKEDGTARTRVLQIEGTADKLPVRDGWADTVFMGHSIHLLPDYDALLSEIRRVLVPGGRFAFNTGFYAGGYPPGTENYYTVWLRTALEIMTRKHPTLRRKRGTIARYQDWLSQEEWRERLQAHGFDVEHMGERTIMMTQRSHEAVGAYTGFSRVLLSGFPPDLASEALVEAAGPAMKECGFDELPRNWLEVSARKGSTSG